MNNDSEIKLLSFDVTEEHHTMHKCLGLIDIMLHEAEREKKEGEGE